MALDVYWREHQKDRYLGSLEIDTSLEGLLYAFGKLTGIPVDPYGKARLHPTQWERLLQLASQRNYPIHVLKEITAGLPLNKADGMLLFFGD